MPFSSKKITNILKRWLKTSLLILLLVNLSVGLSAAWWNSGDTDTSPKRESVLPPGNAITNPKALLRYALPIDNKPIRQIQSTLEDISEQLRAKRWKPIESYVSKIEIILKTRDDKILEDVPEAKQPEAEALIAQIQEGLKSLREAAIAQDKPTTQQVRNQLLDRVGEIETLMVTEFPFEVPSEYSHLPQLKGRATVEMDTEFGPLTIVVDGYSAPVTAGNFVDLVQRGFYDDMEFIRAEGSYVLQTGDPPGPEEGFIDPKTGEYRNIPLEILLRGFDEPVYGITLEDAGLYREQPVLPFSAYGAVAMARPQEDPDGGSSQFFFFLFEPELTPAGLNLLDGRYTIFGFVVEGKEILEKLKRGDKILSAKVIEGTENLQYPESN
jgi:peptidylprolyl isomerase